MKKVNLQSQNLNPNFIGSWIMEPHSICDELITYFEAIQKKQKKGLTVSGTKLEPKNSTDIRVSPTEVKLPENDVFETYFHNLFSFYEEYVIQWPFLKTFAKTLQVGGFNLQRYQSGEHFQSLHTERTSLDTLHRIFAWMTYLNDVDEKDGGSTYFTHYDLEVQPRKG